MQDHFDHQLNKMSKALDLVLTGQHSESAKTDANLLMQIISQLHVSRKEIQLHHVSLNNPELAPQFTDLFDECVILFEDFINQYNISHLVGEE